MRGLMWFLLFTTSVYLRNNRFSGESLSAVTRWIRDGIRPVACCSTLQARLRTDRSSRTFTRITPK